VQLPIQLIESLKRVDGFDEDAFISVHATPNKVTSIRVNPFKSILDDDKNSIHHSSLNVQKMVPWTQYGFYLETRPSFTFDPLFHAGCYYVQEASSMFLEQAVKQTIDLSRPVKVLDLCAAPGGKSTHIQSLISEDSLLVSNEVIKSRANILKDNLIKWGSENAVVTSNDPKDFARLENYFDVIIIDAPCSGSGLFRRDEETMQEWSLNNVALCSQRQRRILADVWPALKQNGILIYSTCSYSKEEDEDILDWIGRQFAVSSLPLKLEESWNIAEVKSNDGNWGYRFWPYNVEGEGFFMSCFQKTDGSDASGFQGKNKIEKLMRQDAGIVQSWLSEAAGDLYKHNNEVYSLTDALKKEINRLLSSLHVLYCGITIGELFRNKFVPAHSLAMCRLVNKQTAAIELDKEQSIRFLQKKDFENHFKMAGWHLVTFEGFHLGWVKVLSNRINNYYPKELRILKEI
jgi:16S rRNA C967 or C1407 C5-methylase (RsmB/RsmF family)/NOL1/NOP2/fmu family ribosome biogenesis protein